MRDWSEETTGLCPTCLRTVPAVLAREADNTIWITQQCSRHGPNRALLASDADEYLRFRTYVPGRVSGACCGPGELCGMRATGYSLIACCFTPSRPSG